MIHEDLQRKYGNDSNIARALGVSRQLVFHWKRKGIPYGRQCMIQLATKGRLRADEPKREDVAA
jgi:DNA-binding transcriptional regulator YdaS (Cro superfamily)